MSLHLCLLTGAFPPPASVNNDYYDVIFLTTSCTTPAKITHLPRSPTRTPATANSQSSYPVDDSDPSKTTHCTTPYKSNLSPSAICAGGFRTTSRTPNRVRESRVSLSRYPHAVHLVCLHPHRSPHAPFPPNRFEGRNARTTRCSSFLQPISTSSYQGRFS